MLQADAEEIKKAIDEHVKAGVESGLSEEEAWEQALDELIPRVCYFGHKVIHTFRHPDRRAKWECIHCKNQWVSEEGHQCPSCLRCGNDHLWEWVSEPYGPEDRACKYCKITLEEDMGPEKFQDYIRREQEGRKKLEDQAKENTL